MGSIDGLKDHKRKLTSIAARREVRIAGYLPDRKNPQVDATSSRLTMALASREVGTTLD